MLVLHAVWTRERLHLWAEDASLISHALAVVHAALVDDPTAAAVAEAVHPVHSFACDSTRLRAALVGAGLLAGDDIAAEPALLRIMVPATTTVLGTTALPSDRLANTLGLVDEPIAHLSTFDVPAIAIDSPAALRFLLTPADEERPLAAGVHAGHDIRFWRELAALAADLIADQRVVPSIIQEKSGRFRAIWQPWLADGAPAQRLTALLSAIPASARCVDDEFRSQPWAIIEAALLGFVDAEARRVLDIESYSDAIEDRDPTADPHVAWLSGLLGKIDTVQGTRSSDTHLMRGARQWLSSLDAASESRFVKLAFELNEPDPADFAAADEVGRDAEWTISFKLITNDDPPVVIDAEQIWAQGKDGLKGLLARFGGENEPAGDVLLAELARAARIWPRVERALEESTPCEVTLSTVDAYAFLRDFRPILME
ncbi:MAG: hypothetical protein WCI96_04400, partial [Planctomycetota bacterium]